MRVWTCVDSTKSSLPFMDSAIPCSLASLVCMWQHQQIYCTCKQPEREPVVKLRIHRPHLAWRELGRRQSWWEQSQPWPDTSAVMQLMQPKQISSERGREREREREKERETRTERKEKKMIYCSTTSPTTVHVSINYMYYYMYGHACTQPKHISSSPIISKDTASPAHMYSMWTLDSPSQ